RRCIWIVAPASPAAAAGAGHGNESRNGSGAALARSAHRKRWRDERLAFWRVWDVRYFSDDFASLRIILPDRVLSDVDEPLVIHVHPVPLRRVKGTDDVALLVEMNHCRRMNAAIGNRRIQLCLELDACQIVRPIKHPEVIVLIDSQPRNASEFPLVRQWFGPIRIELIPWRSQPLSF